ncbi:hypothetical protein CEXT_712031 [Caerostris extrusa]|uniref:Uncharacterized protein n=1 Tax=Caerostris extrusa TaxID=172846 RepID=A0AAV4SD62_CAEEX|nr:hypothetical protein CEXT_712031 [Caerostris extrusa]
MCGIFEAAELLITILLGDILEPPFLGDFGIPVPIRPLHQKGRVVNGTPPLCRSIGGSGVTKSDIQWLEAKATLKRMQFESADGFSNGSSDINHCTVSSIFGMQFNPRLGRLANDSTKLVDNSTKGPPF